MPGADSPCRYCPEVLAKQFPFFLHAPTKISKTLEKSIRGCHPKADEATRGSSHINRSFTLTTYRSFTLSFTLTTGNGAQTRLRRLKNGIPQGLVLGPLLFYIYTHDLSATVARKFVYADDLATMHFAEDWQSLQGTLTQDMATLSLLTKMEAEA